MQTSGYKLSQFWLIVALFLLAKNRYKDVRFLQFFQILKRIHLWLFFILLSCAKDDSQFYYGVLDVESPKLIVASAVGASLVLAMYDMDGNFIRVVKDYSDDVLTPRGMAALGPLDFFVSLEGKDYIERINLLSDSSTQEITSAYLAGNVYQMRRHPQYGNFVIETSTIESFTDSGERIGNPRIGTTVGSCVLNTPRGLAITADGYLAVVDIGNDDVLIYDVSDATNPVCVTANTSFGNVDPIAILAHSDGYLYIVTNGDDRVYRLNRDGTGVPTIVYNNINYIRDPTSIVEMPDGTLLVASDFTNTLVRIRTDGTFVGSAPFAYDAFSNYITDMIILQESSP